MNTITRVWVGVLMFLWFGTPVLTDQALPTLVEYTATVETAGGVRATGSLLLPPNGKNITAVLVILAGQARFPAGWRELAAATNTGLLFLDFRRIGESTQAERRIMILQASSGSGEALLALLERFADDSGRPEVRDARLLVWGFSGAGNFGFTFAGAHPDRTIGLIRFQAGPGNLPSARFEVMSSVASLRDTPVLMVAAKGASVTALEEDLWRQGRRLGAPWTLVRQPIDAHGDGLQEATPLMLAWTEAALRLRTSSGRATTANGTWSGIDDTGEILPRAPLDASQSESWLPDERTAQLWRALSRDPGQPVQRK